MEMHDTKLVIFGKPEAGTPVMIAAPDSGWQSWSERRHVNA